MSAGQHPQQGRKSVVQAEGIAYRYPGEREMAVQGLSLSISKGEMFGLLGPNGAGKTTTIAMFCALRRPLRGELRVCGIDLIRQPCQLRGKIGLVPQEIALYPSLTVRENLRYFGILAGIGGTSLNKRVEESLETVGLRDQGNQPIESFSGGMKRRANLAAGIIHKPRLLILDEPTAGVDPQSRGTILAYLARLRQEGCTLIYTTHYLEEAQQICGRVAIVDRGRVIAEGSPERLIASAGTCANLEELFLRLTGRQLRD